MVSIVLVMWLVYVIIGLVFTPIFMWKGLRKVDDGVVDSGWGFKVLIFPGMLVFWPIFANKWRKS